MWDFTEETGEEPVVKMLNAAETITKAITSYGVATGDKPELFPLGLPIVDKHLGGLSPRLFATIAAATGIGKSSVMLACAYNAAKKGCKVGIVSMEDPIEMIGARLAAKITRINDRDIRKGELNAQDRERIFDATVEVSDLPLHVVEVLGNSLAETAAAVRRLAVEGCKVIFVDYIQLVWVEGVSDSRHAMKRALATLHGLAKEYGFALVGVSQVRRPSEGREEKAPTRYMLKESGDLENSSKLLIVIWKEGDVTHVKIEKSNVGCEGFQESYRRGPDGQLHSIIRDSDRSGEASRSGRARHQNTKAASVRSSRAEELDAWQSSKRIFDDGD